MAKLRGLFQRARYHVAFMLFLATIIYLVLGALIVRALESNQDHRLAVLVKRLTKITDKKEQSDLIDAVKEWEAKRRADTREWTYNLTGDLDWWSETTEWSMGSAVLFTFSIVTTIGYGNVTPTRPASQVFCVIYALLGIPLSYLGIAVIGRLFSESCLGLYIRCRVALYRRWPNGRFALTKDSIPHSLPTSFIISAFVTWIFLGTLLLPVWEDLTTWQAAYFSIISLTTVGLGDIYPERFKYFPITYLYLTFGLIITTMMITATAETLRKLQFLGRTIKHLSGVRVNFGSHDISVDQLVFSILTEVQVDEQEKAQVMFHLDNILSNAVYHSNYPSHRYSTIPFMFMQMHHQSLTISTSIATGAPRYPGLKIGNRQPIVLNCGGHCVVGTCVDCDTLARLGILVGKMYYIDECVAEYYNQSPSSVFLDTFGGTDSSDATPTLTTALTTGTTTATNGPLLNIYPQGVGV